ncbi:hypothetical protein GUJ93_ZPchr0012g21207 [Zizania palustris]|uniref:Uncharacterized protein n=1 Tax=Zizania palustris TaxID=103762 RepID=A0A8J5WL50_ZIZPA|nr:hypothetical protein GUJ93_ZPchr0012g21207 [Zizania palustris]
MQLLFCSSSVASILLYRNASREKAANQITEITAPKSAEGAFLLGTSQQEFSRFQSRRRGDEEPKKYGSRWRERGGVCDPGISPWLAADSEGVHLFGTILCLVASEDKCTFLSSQLIGGLERVKLLTSWKGLPHVPFIHLIHSSSLLLPVPNSGKLRHFLILSFENKILLHCCIIQVLMK